MIACRHPIFARLGPKLERAAREIANLDAFLAQTQALPPGPATDWGPAHRRRDDGPRGFRHRVRHRYGFDLDPARTEANRLLLVRTLPRFVEALARLERAVTGTDGPAEAP